MDLKRVLYVGNNLVAVQLNITYTHIHPYVRIDTHTYIYKYICYDIYYIIDMHMYYIHEEQEGTKWENRAALATV